VSLLTWNVPEEFRELVLESNSGKTVLLADQGLESVPLWLKELTTLTTLDLSGNKLVAVPDWLGSLTALTTLNLGGNRLTAVPGSLGKLTALRTLDLGGNRLTAVPKSLGNLTALTALNLGRSYRPTAKPTDARPVNGPSPALQQMDVTLLRIATTVDFPRPFPRTPDLGGNRLTTVPKSLGKLTALHTLDLSGNRLTTVPKSLGKLTALRTLDLSGNRLTGIPESLGKLTGLTTIDLNGNWLTGIPESLGKLTALRTLDLSGNRLTGIPESLGKLTGLDSLDLEDNPLSVLPQQLADLRTDGLRLRLTSKQQHDVTFVTSSPTWSGELLDRVWARSRSLLVPSVSLSAVLAAADTTDPAAAILQLYTWERDRLLTLAKGTAGAAFTVLTALIAVVFGSKTDASGIALSLAAALVVMFLFWGGFLLAGLGRLAEEYATALDLRKDDDD
jgi:Leucine-rich repeat (LRR) protein